MVSEQDDRQDDVPPEDDQFDDELFDEDPYPTFPEEVLPIAPRPPGLDFRFPHFFGMALVAAIILGIVVNVNGGNRNGQAAEKELAPAAGSASTDPAATFAAPTYNTEAEAEKAAPTIRYISEMTSACQNTSGSLAQLETMLNDYSVSPDIRKDEAWRNRIARPLLAADDAANHLITLSNPPPEFTPINDELRSAGRELRSSVSYFAKTIESGSQTYMNLASEHEKNCRRLIDQAGDEFLAYRKKLGY
jgi:hypothetical protein